MEPRVRYRSAIMDNVRWEGFPFREGDIVITTPPKCGTTWTQMICALLIFGSADLPQPLDVMSPWVDQLVRNRDEMLAALDAQTHRRFVKTHTPLDGLPWDDRVTYVAVSRDPRDAAVSMDNHMRNIDWDIVRGLIEDAGEATDDTPPPPELPDAPYERFWHWMDTDSPGRGLHFTLHHIDTFWQARTRPNVVLLRYEDLQADLEGQIRHLASNLGIEVDEERLPGLVDAARFESMKQNAAAFAPNATNSIWRDTGRFFNEGRSGQWRDLLDPDDLDRYRTLVAGLVEPELSEWIHAGPI